MDKAQVSRFLKAVGSIALGQSSSGWVTASCPLSQWTHGGGFDKNPSFAIRIAKESNFNCFSCGHSDSMKLTNLVWLRITDNSRTP